MNGRPAPPPSWWQAPWLWLGLLALVAYLLHLGTPPLWDANEPLYAQPPAEVVSWPEGDLLAPTWNGKTYFAHPPLSTWVTVPFYEVLGISAGAQRLPMALACLLAAWGVLVLARRLGMTRETAWMAALVFLATPRVWLFARQLSGDIYLLTLLVWAFACAVPAFASDTEPARARRGLRIAAVLVGLAILTKGPVALALFAGPLGVAWLLSGRPVPLATLRPVRGVLLALAVGSTWSIYMAVRYPEFLSLHYGWYHGARLIGGIGTRGLLFYPRALLGEALPWLLAAPFAWRSRTGLAPFARLLPWCAMGFTLVLFSIPAGKRNVYLLPMYPWLAVVVAPLLVRIRAGASPRLGRLVGVAFGTVALVGAWFLWRMTSYAPRFAPETHVLTALVALGGPAIAVWAWRRPRALPALAIGGVLLLQAGLAGAFPALARYKPIPALAQALRAEADPARPEPAIIYALPIHSLNFYLGRATIVARTPQALLEALDPDRGGYVLTAARYLEPVTLTGRKGERVRARHFDTLRGKIVVREVARGTEWYFNFGRSILGHGRSLRDLVLLHVSHIAAGEGSPEAPPDLLR